MSETDQRKLDVGDEVVLKRFPNIAKRISTRLGLLSAFLVLIPLLIASTIAFLNQGASPQTQEAVTAQLSQQASKVADSLQWQLASKLNTPLNPSVGSLNSGVTTPLLPKINRELDYRFYDRLYEIAAPLNSDINTFSDPKLSDVLKEIAEPIEAEGAALYIYDSKLQAVYASDIHSSSLDVSSERAAFAPTMLRDFSGERLTELDGESVFVTRRMLPALNWQMVLVQPASTAASRNSALMRPLALLTVLGPLLALLLTTLWSFFKLQRPLNELREGVQRLLHGKQTASVSISRNDELGLLTQEVSLLSQKFSAVVLDESEPKERLFEAQERIKQQYLRENYPEEFVEAEKATSEKGESDVSQVQQAKSEQAKNEQAKQDRAEFDKTLGAKEEHISNLEKELEEARASQHTLTEEKFALESQLKTIQENNQDLVSKKAYEVDLTDLQLQLNDKSQALKGHIRAAKASTLGFNVSESESNINAAEQELDALSNIVTSFGEEKLGIKKLDGKNTGSASVEHTAGDKYNGDKSKKQKQAKDAGQDAKDLANASTPLQTTVATKVTSKQSAKASKAEASKAEVSKAKDTKNLLGNKKSSNKKSSNKKTSKKKEDILTPLPDLALTAQEESSVVNVAAQQTTTSSSLKSSSLKSSGLKSSGLKSSASESTAAPQKAKTPLSAVQAVTLKDAEVAQDVIESSQVKDVKESGQETAQAIDVAAIDYDAALTLGISKDLALKDALERYLHSYKQHTQIQVEHYISEPAALSEENTVLLRDFVKAAFDNIAKHSDASSVLLELNESNDGSSVQLMIVDNGNGFDPEALQSDSQLKQFEKAFSILNGELMFYSSAKEGTMINASLAI